MNHAGEPNGVARAPETGAAERAVTGLLLLKERMATEGGTPELAEAARRALDAIPGLGLSPTAQELCAHLGEGIHRVARSGVAPSPVPPLLAGHTPPGLVDDGSRPLFEAAGGWPAPPTRGGWGDLGAEIIAAIGKKLEESRPRHGWLVDGVRAEVAALRALDRRLPLRYAPAAIHGFVEPLPRTHQGLVHGGVVLGRGLRVVVKAHRFFQHGQDAGEVVHEEVVAGTCEVYGSKGELVQRWSTADRLVERFASCDAPLPSGPCEVRAERTLKWPGTNRTIHVWAPLRGFYRPASILERTFAAPHALAVDLSTPPIVDDGVPCPLYYTGKRIRSGSTSFHVTSGFEGAPASGASIENALYAVEPVASPGFVIDSPYVVVFSPGPAATSMVVGLVSASRVVRFQKRGASPRLPGGVRETRRRQNWTVRLVEAPARPA